MGKKPAWKPTENKIILFLIIIKKDLIEDTEACNVL